MKKISLIICFIFTVGYGFTQIKSNERLVYAASYNMSGMMTQLAQVTMTTETIKTSRKAFLHLSWEAATFSKWDSFFKIRDLYESYVDPQSLKPSLYKRNIFEGGYVKAEKYIFSPNGRSITSTTKKKNKPETKKTFAIGGATQDIISMIYKLRTINFSQFKPGQSTSFIIVFDEKEYPVYVKYMGVETVSAGNLGKKQCFKVSIAAKTDKLRGKDKNLIWITADESKVPALIRFSIPVGTGQLTLSSASGI
ncbi:MAG: DUF3108 domain-containing protein [Paludibacter sp.]|nr:DUF3108 domain-containing protein [Paludibacter sp.]